MSSSVGLLDFFILEASDYLERLDGFLAGAATGGAFDADSFAKYSRALRGSATMARVPGMAELAGTIERIGRSVRDGAAAFDQALHGALVAAVEDLKILLRSVRGWGKGEDARANARIADLAPFIPALARASGATPAAGVGATAFLANETAEIASALDAFVEQTGDAAAFGQALRRVRALRGVAGLRDLPPLGDVVDAIERAAKPIELGAAPTQPQLALLFAAAQLLRRTATAFRVGTRPDLSSPEVQRFTAAAALLDAGETDEAERIVPISDLFYADAGPHLVARAPQPPTTPAERFRLEVVSQAEHLRRLLADALQAQAGAGRDAVARELRHALRALQSAAESFGERDLARFVEGTSGAVVALEPRAIQALAEVASVLANQSARPDGLRQQLGGAPAQPAPVSAARPQSPRAAAGGVPRVSGGAPGGGFGGGAASRSYSGHELQALLADSIAGIARLESSPLSHPMPLEDEIVPVEMLLYRGATALARARELRQAMAAGGGTPDGETLAELFDLLDLAAAE